MKSIVIAGGSGLIGRAVAAEAAGRGYRVVILTRKGASPGADSFPENFLVTDYKTIESQPSILPDEPYIFVNLAGASVGVWPWSRRRKEMILLSRLEAVIWMKAFFIRTGIYPDLILQASATGFYGNTLRLCTEESPSGNGFLASVVRQWESALHDFDRCRVVWLRTGVVLAREGGALERLAAPLKFAPGVWMGNGKQYFPWIHIQDVSGVMLWLTENNIHGPVNLVAPEAVTNKTFMQALCERMHRPLLFGLPVPLIRLMVGKTFADEMILNNQHVVPEKLIKGGYPFRFPELNSSLNDLLPDE
ncbi:MAG: TIGR01777 family oxidoreductase [Bacteroidales bacterium]